MDQAEIDRITAYLDVRTEVPAHADLAFCFGGQLTTPAKIAADAYKNGIVHLVVVTGGINQFGLHEAPAFREVLLHEGVPEEQIIVEPHAANTHQNVTLSVPLVEEIMDLSDISSILAITKWYHSRRALMTLKRWWPYPVRMYSLNYEPPAMPRTGWQNIPDSRERIVREYEKIPRYLADGNLSDAIEEKGYYV